MVNLLFWGEGEGGGERRDQRCFSHTFIEYWADDPLTSVTFFSDCPLLPSSIPNGVSNGTGSVEGSHHHFSCNVGYALVGTNTLYCSDEGTWNGTVPTCLIGNILNEKNVDNL